MTAQSGQASPADERREVVAKVLDHHLPDGAYEIGCAMRCGFYGDDLAEHLADAVLAALSPSDEARGAEVERLRGEVERLTREAARVDDHCGHIDSPCGCDNPPDPTQAYYAMKRRAERLRADTVLAEEREGRAEAALAAERERVQRVEALINSDRVLVYLHEVRRALSGDTEGGDQ